MENVAPSKPPITATTASGIVQVGLKSPLTVCPRKPIKAVAATIAEDVPMAIRIGTPQARTIKGILNEPPETPTIPAANPVAAVIGITNQRLMVYSQL